jgi:hypothetical protein
MSSTASLVRVPFGIAPSLGTPASTCSRKLKIAGNSAARAKVLMRTRFAVRPSATPHLGGPRDLLPERKKLIADFPHPSCGRAPSGMVKS